MLAYTRNGVGRTSFGSDLRDDPASTGFDPFSPTSWITAATNAASTAAANVTNAVDCANAYAPVVAVAAEAKWSIKKPLGMAIAGGATLIGVLAGIAIGHHTALIDKEIRGRIDRAHHATSAMGRRRRRR